MKTTSIRLDNTTVERLAKIFTEKSEWIMKWTFLCIVNGFDRVTKSVIDEESSLIS